MNVTLTVIAGPHEGREFVFDRHDTFLVGRAKDVHFQLSYDDPYFSRRHFVVEVNPPRVRVYDLNSRNGVSVNGQKVRSADLKDGDELKAGHTVFRVNVPAEEQQTLDLPAAALPSASPPGLAATGAYTGLFSLPGYRVQREIGRGAMGIVYQAVRDSDGLAVAVKVITPASGTSAKNVKRFLRESAITVELDHPYIIRGIENGEHEGLLYLVMELATGPDLEVRVKERGPMKVSKAVRLTMQMLDGLAHAHAKGYVHRDVKPSNLLLDGPKDRRVAKLADFGLAKAYTDCGISGVTMQGEAGGSPAFMAPEHLTHYREVKPRADQYSAAATLYYLLTGQFVLDFESTTQARMLQIATEPRVPIQERRSDLPAGLAKVIHKALALDPEKRFADASTLRGAIQSWALDTSI